MEERIRLYNPHKFNVGIITPDKKEGLNIVPGSFTVVNRDELDYLMSTTTVIRDGVLLVQEDKREEVQAVLGIDMENNANFMSDEDIKKKLSGSVTQLKKWLNSGDIQPYILDKIAEIAKGMNLNMNKIQVLQEKLPKYDFFKK